MRLRVCIALTSLIFGCILVLQPDVVSAYSNVASQVTATSAPGSATVTLKWGAASNATRYEARVRIGSSSGMIFRSSGTIGSTGRTFSFTGVEYNLKYVVGVRAGDADSWGAFVYADPVVPEAADPNPPAKPDISSPADGQITINWDIKRQSGDIYAAMLLAILMLISAAASFSVTKAVWVGKRPPSINTLAWLAAFLFAMFQIRASLPGDPPNGNLYDLLIFYPILLILLLQMAMVVYLWIRRDDWDLKNVKPHSY